MTAEKASAAPHSDPRGSAGAANRPRRIRTPEDNVRSLQVCIAKATATSRNRVPQGAFEWLEPDDGKLSRPVLRGGCGGNAAPLLSEAQSHTGANTPLQFVGALGYQTWTTNRTYVRARYYRPDLGRWQTRDPLMDGLWYNGYWYVGAMPLTWVDPSGLIAIEWNGCNETEKRRILAALTEVCGPAGKGYRDCLSETQCRIGGYPGFPGDDNRVRDCIEGFCGAGATHPKKLKVSCCGGWEFCNITVCRGACAFTVPGKEIVVCARRIWDRSHCDRLACVLAHEFIHLCGQIGHGPRTGFECMPELDPKCKRTRH